MGAREVAGLGSPGGAGEGLNGLRITHIGGPTVLLEVGAWRLPTDPTFVPPAGGAPSAGVVVSEAGWPRCRRVQFDRAPEATSFFTVGTVVRLDARAASDSSFRGWSTNLPGCANPREIA